METIYKNKPIKEQFEKLGITYPILKSSKKWGVRGSCLLDSKTEEICLNKLIDYLTDKQIIELI